MSKSALRRRAKEARAWLFDSCFPLWSTEGVLSNGLFAEALSLEHAQFTKDFVRVRVQARQTFVFSEALQLGWRPEQSLELVKSGLRTLMTQCRRPDGLIGRTLDSDTGIYADDTPELYDTAFVLFALASAARIEPLKAEALETAQSVWAAVDKSMLDPVAGGYSETLPRGPKRHQNPHMHLLEACLALHDVDPHGGHLTRATEIVGLFESRFTAGPKDLLAELFTADWTNSEGRDANIVEPGHQFEWAWLLQVYANAANLPVSDKAATLFAFGQANLDSEGRSIQETTRDGAVEDGSRRTWPQTEALKAQLTMYELTGDDSIALAACQTFDVLMDEFLTPQGGWIDHYTQDGAILAQNMPASTGYHVVLAFSELIRVMGA